MALAERGELNGLCPAHGNQTIPWALQTEIAEAILAHRFPDLREPSAEAPPNREAPVAMMSASGAVHQGRS
ncbi:MAG: hypothetical protein JWN34_246 [Bryobacterales bacterium]|nr:hypothetical protein [Bryobacterales bacterium]